ncbi:molybdopterin synthase catalytic subunit MoaE [Halioxenophilus sp. WMMB6]|uniref:molybdopterin synthase catalytic subunit MoaE n=1 Tax=Halioxenophilus sp. WMMB6 TaxID=3073815 RepID=UPI00295EBFA7|nr:molybdopterin synthase catalytic subunit MoaE [Halioxenophilus sp. WMMB6]
MTDTLFTIGVQAQDFAIDAIYSTLTQLAPTPGAIVFFSGLVRDFDHNQNILGLELEHYPGMTESSLTSIAKQASERWPLQAVTIIHRIGKLKAGDQIVAVGVASRHRADSFQAAEFIMDYLKNDAPFWKKELRSDGDFWVDAKQSDLAAKQRWQKD